MRILVFIGVPCLGIESLGKQCAFQLFRKAKQSRGDTFFNQEATHNLVKTLGKLTFADYTVNIIEFGQNVKVFFYFFASGELQVETEILEESQNRFFKRFALLEVGQDVFKSLGEFSIEVERENVAILNE